LIGLDRGVELPVEDLRLKPAELLGLGLHALIDGGIETVLARRCKEGNFVGLSASGRTAATGSHHGYDSDHREWNQSPRGGDEALNRSVHRYLPWA
jgi:hypothetical protein